MYALDKHSLRKVGNTQDGIKARFLPPIWNTIENLKSHLNVRRFTNISAFTSFFIRFI